MAKTTQVQLSFIHGRVIKLRDFGRDHRMQTSQGTLKNATIAMNIIDFILDLYYDPLTIRFLQDVGGRFLEHLNAAWWQYLSSKGYSKYKRR